MSLGVKVRRTSTDPDSELIRRLYDEHGAALYRFCVRFTQDQQRAEEVVQDTFLKAWRSLSQVDLTDRPVRPWLLTIARNTLTDVHRAQQSRPFLVGDEQIASVPAPDVIDRALENWRVADALGGLTAEHRVVLVHQHWLGHSVQETADALGIPPGTVKSRTYYALRALRLSLEESDQG